ncbi:hypothetical protein [Galactobacter caseinivorans]|uniref:Uncharacterized protein n=1 Tax=Galactobacter caseinivorans TaxID=2676123 RepID=A0A496PG25_9MICC|nr:hypothetical protein [Galactobacter caseinivorans]RKW69375.1 hypothetical protein DWQ67_13515 [Galactobacter caseinivorans]
MPMNRADLKLYRSLVDAALAAVPKDTDRRVRQFMGKRMKQSMGIDEINGTVEMGYMANLWAALGYQDAMRHLYGAMMIRVSSQDGRLAPNSLDSAMMAWPAEYANLTGYAHLFNRTNTPPFPLSRVIMGRLFTDPSEFHRAYIGTPQIPGTGWGHKDVIRPIRHILDDMEFMGIHRLATTNDWGWNRERFNQELELHATNLRQFLGFPATKPHMPVDPHVFIPDGFTHLPVQHATEAIPSPEPTRPLPGLEHLPAPIPTGNPLPPEILLNQPDRILPQEAPTPCP